MRHILLAQPVTAVSFGMLEAASSALLVAPAGFLDASAACGLRAASGTIDLAPVAAAADDDLGSAVMAQEESAGGFHWRFPSRQGAIDRKRPLVKYSPCTRAQHGVGHDIGVNFAGLAGVVLVLLGGPFLPHREPVCHPRLDPLAASAANFPSGRRAAGGRVFSRPSGSFRHAPPPHHRWPNRPQHPDSSRPRTIPRRQPPLRLAANYRHFLTAIDTRVFRRQVRQGARFRRARPRVQAAREGISHLRQTATPATALGQPSWLPRRLGPPSTCVVSSTGTCDAARSACLPLSF